MKTQEDIRQWLRKSNNYGFDVKFHCHGVRVTLKYDYYDITSWVANTIEEAFEGAVSGFDVALSARYAKMLKEEEELRERWVQDYNCRIENAKRRLQEINERITKA